MNSSSLSGFLSGFATAYFSLLAYQLLTRKEASRLQRVLGVIFVQWALFNLKDFLLTLNDYNSSNTWNIITLIDGLSLIGYTCLLYEVIAPKWASWRKVCLMLLGYIPFFVAYYLMPGTIVIRYYIVCLFLAGTAILLHWIVQARRYKRYIRDSFSNIDEIDISWLRVVSWFFVICQLIWVVTCIVRNPWIDCLYYLLSIILWQITLEHIMHHQPAVIDKQDLSPTPPIREYAFAQTLPETVEAEELFLNPTLSIKDLAQLIGTNRTYLSDYFVHVKQTSFYDYINGLRIEKKSVALLTEHPEYTMERIASESGFRSVSTFRRAFLKQKGVTPSEYRKQLKNN
ncbi:MAG: AraC family transcriptional regulator [Bacteroidaceae bacterium]|nr:AraC family transcriptional regulator [Bacteroidaceae bacterium]